MGTLAEKTLIGAKTMVHLFSFLFRYSPSLMMVALFTGLLTGLSNMGLIAILNEAMDRGSGDKGALAFIFIGLGLSVLVFRVSSQLLTATIGQRGIYDLRIHLSRQIIQTPLRKLEDLGPGTLYTSLTADVNAVSMALSTLPAVCMQLAIVVAGFIYLFYLNVYAGFAVMAGLVIGLPIYILISIQGRKFFDRARDQNDLLFQNFEALTRGTKELKLHVNRRKTFINDFLSKAAQGMRRNIIGAQAVFATGGSVGNLFFFAALGVCVFVLPLYYESVTPQVLKGYAMVLLFMIIPLEALTNIAPILGNAIVAFRRIERLGITLKEIGREEESLEEVPPTWNTLEYRGITHTYHREKEDRTFTMGPIDMSLKPGEIVFLVGGNGSGKTTLAKMLMGLYIPEAGEVLMDGQPITDTNRDSFRQRFTAVFSDFYLFDNLMGLEGGNLDQKARAYLESLQLHHKVSVEAGQLSTVDLSQGQRKRLALLTAYLEDRPIYVFDEWAADQDPLFKSVFYNEILDELKRRNKTVIVISHDDAYFNKGDRVVKLDYGKIAFDVNQDHYHEAHTS